MASNAANKKTAAASKTAASDKNASQPGSRKTNTNTTASKSKAKNSQKDTESRRRAKRESFSDSVADTQRNVSDNSNPMLAREALLWLILALCVFIYIGYCGLGGYVGNVISDICFGIFGIAAWVFPVLLFLASAFWISNKGNRLAWIKFASCVGLYFCICCFAALIGGGYDDNYNPGKLYASCASFKQGGGVIGETICYFLAPAFGKTGTAVFFSVLTLIALVLITQKSLIGGVKKQGNRFYQSAKESSRRYREEKKKREDWARFEELSVPLPDADPEQQESFERTPSFQRNRITVPEKTKHEKSSDVSRPDSFQIIDMEYVNQEVSTSDVPETFYTEYTGKSKRKGKKQPVTSPVDDRQLDVSVMFSTQNPTRRHHHHASGVTTDTRITGEASGMSGEFHEILPRAYEPAGVSFVDGAFESEIGTATDENEQNDGSCYIDLEKDILEDTTKISTTGRNVSMLSVERNQDMVDFPLHIEGVEEEKSSSAETVHEESSVQREQRIRTEAEPPSNLGGIRSDVENHSRQRIQNAMQTQSPEQEQPENREASVGNVSGKIKRNPHSSEKEIAEGIASVEAEAAKAAKAVCPEYVFPPLDLLKKGTSHSKKGQEQEIRQTAAKLQQTLNSFGVHVTVTNVSCGPSVTRYELLPEQGVKVSRIVSLADDIKLNLAAADIRIEAPIPGKSAVGIEVPNSENATVPLRDLLESDEFQKHPSKLAFATGKDLGGRVVVSDIAKMPHLLIAGATGSGKSVCINTLIMSILYKARPDEVKLIMIDPKVVELSVYNGIPHLLIPVVTDPKKAAGALNWAVAEMTDRYAKFARMGVRDLKGYNQKISVLDDVDDPEKPEKLPQIVIIVDELADLMMVAPGEVEDSICRLAQLARAAGLHLIIATQRPSVNVITGLIKANMPSRIAFSVSSGVDSRTIIDMYGAEKLLGKGDMLFYPQGYQKPARVQGAFVSDEEVSDVVDFLKNSNSSVVYNAEMNEQIAKAQLASSPAKNSDDTDELFAEAGKFIIEKDKASIGMLQRVFKIGFNRAARIMDQLSDAGVVGPEEGTKPRKILMSQEQFENYLEEN